MKQLKLYSRNEIFHISIEMFKLLCVLCAIYICIFNSMYGVCCMLLFNMYLRHEIQLMKSRLMLFRYGYVTILQNGIHQNEIYLQAHLKIISDFDGQIDRNHLLSNKIFELDIFNYFEPITLNCKNFPFRFYSCTSCI